MADCSYSRCIQQKRNIRRELQRWTKNMVYIVGLERIAEELMGRRKWKLYQESMSRNYLQPLNNNIKKSEEYLNEDLDSKIAFDRTDEEEKINSINENIKVEVKQEDSSKDQEVEDRLKDWSPQIKCYFCIDGKLDSGHNNHGGLSPRHTDSESSDSPSDTDASPTLTPPTSLLNNHRNNMTTIENIAANIAGLAVLAPGSTVSHLPFYPPSLHNLPTPWYLSSTPRNFHHDRTDMEKTSEQPLDLSSKAGNNTSFVENKVPTNMRLPTLDTKHIFKAKPRMPTVAGRRTYTEDELQAALRDIQSGKLGTRRAAVIYGIPRSTLRNKVYKLALERERESHLNTTSSLKIEEEEIMEDDKELSGAEEEKEVEKALLGPLLSMEDILRLSNTENTEALRNLLKGKEDVWSGLEHSAVGPYIQNLLSQSGILPAQKPLENEVNPMLREVLRKIIVDEKIKTQQNNNDNDRLIRPSPSNSVVMRYEKTRSESDMETEDTPSNVILKIPSFKPTTSKNGCDFYRSPIETGSLVSPPVTSESGSPPILPPKMSLKDVKDVIARTINHRFQQSPDPVRHQVIDMDYKRSGFTPPISGIPGMKTPPDIGRPPYQPQNKPPLPTNSGSSQGGKGTRPKRGKYRNYDRDSLVEAVRAVQRGEMSVHRAGSYYGVPHSTLEYKVKERHLMRPRKRDPKPNPVDEKIASLKQNDIRCAAEKMKPIIKPPQKFPPTSPNGMKIPIFDHPSIPLGYNPAPFPFWPHPGFPHIPLEYGRTSASAFPTNTEQFFASQMMQKLQEESRTHSNPTTPSTTPNSTPTLAKNARQIAESLLDGSGANGSFLDGIIRSSLESGVPLNEDKLPKEENNVAPENMSNKALLDQLCRNSRLTPLPKISEPSSSGDESYRKGSSPLVFTSGNSRDEQKSESSPRRDDGSEIHTIELSNDSNESLDRKENDDEQKTTLGRLYLKTELTKPENLQPEKLIRYRDLLHDVERNGIGESVTGSASDTDAVQD